MATLNANQTSAGVQPKVLRVGLVSVTATFSLAASLSTGDVIQMIKVPANGRVVDLRADYQSDGQGSIVVGDGGDTDRYITDTAVSSGLNTTLRLNNATVAPYTYSVDDTIDVVCSLSSTQPSTGAIYVTAIIEYPGP